MARFRQYKNGIFGHRYKGYYVIRNIDNGEKTFDIIDEKKDLVKGGYSNYWDCEWEIDKMTASPEQIKVIKGLYAEEIYILSGFFLELMEKSNNEGLSQEENELYSWVKKVRSRKAKNKPY